MANEAQEQTVVTQQSGESTEQQPATAVETVNDSDYLDFDAIGTMLEFDPFAKDEADSSTAPDQISQQSTTEPSVDAGATPVEPTQQQGTEQGAEPSPAEAVIPEEVKVLMQQLQAAQTTIAQLQQQQQQPQPQPQQQQDPYAAYIPSYEYNVPEPLAQLLDSENPQERMQGVQAIMTGISRTVHRQMLEQFQGILTTFVPRQLEQHQQMQNLRSEIQRDFYGTYKELDHPDVRALVTTIAPQVMQELNVSDWSPALRDALATRVKAMLGYGRVTPAVPAQPQPQPTILDQGSRGPITQPNDIESTLFG